MTNTETYDAEIAKSIRAMVNDARTEGREGAPIGWVPLAFQPTLDAMLAAGDVVLVDRPRVVNPAKTATFVCFPKGQ